MTNQINWKNKICFVSQVLSLINFSNQQQTVYRQNMSKNLFQKKEQAQMTPKNQSFKLIQRTTIPKKLSKRNASSEQTTQNKNSKDPSKVNTQKSLSWVIEDEKQNQPQANSYQLEDTIKFLENCLSQYKLQMQSLCSKLNEKEKYFKLSQSKYQQQIGKFMLQVRSLQYQLKGQQQLIEESLQKYDLQIRRVQLQKKQIQTFELYKKQLQKNIQNSRQVSVNLIKENQSLKFQMGIQKEQYQILFRDYDSLTIRHQRTLKELQRQNKTLLTKIDQLQIQVKLFQKDKQIQDLLIYENSIQKRQRQYVDLFQCGQSPLTISNEYSPSHHYRDKQKYEFQPKRLNFQGQTSRENKYQQLKNKEWQLQQVIQLQKNKIINLEVQIKLIQKRNKQLQVLMVKFMK